MPRLGERRHAEKPGLVIRALPRLCFGVLLLQLSMNPLANEFAGRVRQRKDKF